MDFEEPGVRNEGAVQLEFALSGGSYPFIEATAETDARFALQELLPRSGEVFVEYFAVDGVNPRAPLAVVESCESLTARVLSSSQTGGLVEFEVEGGCPAVWLADKGAIPRVVRSKAGEGTIVAEVPEAVDASAVANSFAAAHPSATLRARRQHGSGTSPFLSSRRFDAGGATLSERQQEAIEAAHEAGYYEWPRDVTAEAVAEVLDITPPTFHEHRRAAERKLIGQYVGHPVSSDQDTEHTR